MTPDIKPKAGILDIAPYVGGESKAHGAARVVKLSSNEGALGPSPLAVEALQKAALDKHRYPDGSCADLRAALARKHGIPVEHIVCGAGSDEIISLLCQAYVGAGDEVLYSEHGFLMYAINAQAAGAVPVCAPEKGLKADMDALLGKVSEKTKIVFLANPNNPTGSYLTKDEVRRLREGLPKDVLLVLDCAYAEYVDAPDYSAGHEMVEAFGNVVVTRTFSKLYGMGGLRLGWGHCPPEIADVLNRVRGPFNVSSVAQAAGLAALADEDFVQKSIAHNTRWRGWLAEKLSGLGLHVYPSAANFILVDFGDVGRAEECRLFLKDRGILVRQVERYKLPACLRISIGTGEEMALVFEGVKDFIRASHSG